MTSYIDCGEFHPDREYESWFPIERKLNAFDFEILRAGFMSGDVGAITLAMQLAGVPACTECGYRKKFCRCFNHV
jgi:hypothetical protein